MTIRQIFAKHSNLTSLVEGDYEYLMDLEDFTNAVKELIEYHVKEALLKASEDADTIFDDGQCEVNQAYSIDKDSILNSYPLDLIK